MNGHKKSPNLKRQHKNDDSVPASHSKYDPLLADQSVQTTKITDLNDDCLERIFMLLELKNLLNVMLTNKWLGPAARQVYKRKFGAHKVCLHSVHNNRNSCATASIVCNQDNINITDFKSCLQFIRCFGSSITHLKIYYGHVGGIRYDYVHEYINQYCAESLITIRFHCKSAFAIKNFEKPFVNVQTVQLYGCDLFELLPFGKWFPSVRELNIHGFGLKHRLIPTSPTQLEHLSITLTDIKRDYVKTLYGCIGNLVRSNRKLEKLTIKTFTKIEMNSLLKVIKHNRNVSQLAESTDLKPDCVNGMGTMLPLQEHPLLVQYCHQLTTSTVREDKNLTFDMFL